MLCRMRFEAILSKISCRPDLQFLGQTRSPRGTWGTHRPPTCFVPQVDAHLEPWAEHPLHVVQAVRHGVDGVDDKAHLGVLCVLLPKRLSLCRGGRGGWKEEMEKRKVGKKITANQCRSSTKVSTQYCKSMFFYILFFSSNMTMLPGLLAIIVGHHLLFISTE